MHDIWLLPPQQRLKKWRNFRKELSDCDTKTVIKACLDMWVSAPIASRFLDIQNSSSWLKPWDLVWSGDFDEDSITLGLAYTLYLSGIENTNILVVIDDKKTFEKLIVVIDNEHVLRYSYSGVSSIDVLSSVTIKNEVRIKDII